ADYIPSEDVLLMYEDGDVRFESFFLAKQLNIQTTDYLTFVFYKYPGNSEMAGNGRINKPKPFRASELYLILAEAYAMQGTDPGKGLGYLNDLLEARYEAGKFTELVLQGSALVERIREERAKEFIGEGFRMSDLKRWGIGFTRNINYPAIDQIAGNPDPLKNALNPLGALSYEPNDYHYTWPIPASEMDINPQLEGQQNPGY
ncbi:MAG: RagB/SusD family nutrient uptake outer membrane protein, partial [Muribaculaceae bacterium]|nr:RagB/SusD family nutrient uptake outer membrane protein [Muribaculaceae bacterium]